MSKVRIAQIGTSAYSHGLEIFDTLKKANNIFEIAGYVLPENEREKFPDRMGVFDGYPELTLEQVLNNSSIQAVTIETEEIYLTKYALMAAKHGKKIHMEKPGGTDLKEFEELIEYVKKNNIVFQTGYMYRYNPIIKKVIKDAKNGEYGEIVSVEAQMNCRHKDCLREWLSTFKGGMMFFLGCHLIDLIIQIQGMPKNVIALNKCSGMNGINSEDYGMAVLEYDNGNSFAKTCDVEYGGFARRQLVITGTKKTVEIKPLERYLGKDLFTDVTTYDVEDWNDNGVTERSELYDRYLDMMTDFAEMVQGKKENPYSYDYELELYKLILRCCGLSGGGCLFAE